MAQFIKRMNEQAENRRNQNSNNNNDNDGRRRSKNNVKAYDPDQQCTDWLDPFNTKGVSDQNGVIGYPCHP